MTSQIYLFYGEEILAIEERIKKLKKPGLNVEPIDGSSPNLEQLMTSLQTQSLFAEEKMVLVKNADFKNPFWNEVAPALENLSTGVVVVFWASSMTKRAKIYKFIDKIGEVYEFKSFAPWEDEKVVSWVISKVNESNKNIKRQAAERLIEICGTSLLKLSSEIEKLITYVGEKTDILPDDVEALASPGEISVFALSEAVSNRSQGEALATFRTLCRNKVSLFPMLSLLAGQFRTMLLTKSESNFAKLAQDFRLSPYYAKKCAQKARKFSSAELARNLDLLHQTDLKLKSGEDQSTLFELLLSDLCSK
ncbi:MAG: DNA polymerase III subunit delta [bacterium]|nr:DNA polymerase III subunit delta [Candidatus Margulisiibacteriota bacterium]